jgi:hypothetical protein
MTATLLQADATFGIPVRTTIKNAGIARYSSLVASMTYHIKPGYVKRKRIQS